MVVKLDYVGIVNAFKFESSVISYGSQTRTSSKVTMKGFESSVISYGSQTAITLAILSASFESSVISYGSQTPDTTKSR